MRDATNQVERQSVQTPPATTRPKLGTVARMRLRGSTTAVLPVRAIRIACAVALLAGRTFAADDEADTFPGLVGRYRGASKSITRIDPDIAFDWAGDSPDPRLPRGPFSVRWTGQLLIRDATPFRFHAFVQGTVKLSIDGRVVLSGRREQPGWISGKAESIGF